MRFVADLSLSLSDIRVVVRFLLVNLLTFNRSNFLSFLHFAIDIFLSRH